MSVSLVLLCEVLPARLTVTVSYKYRDIAWRAGSIDTRGTHNCGSDRDPPYGVA